MPSAGPLRLTHPAHHRPDGTVRGAETTSPPSWPISRVQTRAAFIAPTYELGRNALARDISLLDLVRTHHSVLGEVLQTENGGDTQRDLLDAAAAFLVEALAPFEIARRGFMETSTPHHHRTQPDTQP